MAACKRSGAAAPALVGIEMKWVALFLLVVQNTALVLLMRSSLTAPGEHYIVTTAVACMEGVKVATCLVVEGWGFPSLAAYAQHLSRELFKPKELAMLAVPSLLYTLQNNLLYIALANLDAAIYQVCCARVGLACPGETAETADTRSHDPQHLLALPSFARLDSPRRSRNPHRSATSSRS
jgi:hypothetical protein